MFVINQCNVWVIWFFFFRFHQLFRREATQSIKWFIQSSFLRGLKQQNPTSPRLVSLVVHDCLNLNQPVGLTIRKNAGGHLFQMDCTFPIRKRHWCFDMTVNMIYVLERLEQHVRPDNVLLPQMSAHRRFTLSSWQIPVTASETKVISCCGVCCVRAWKRDGPSGLGTN